MGRFKFRQGHSVGIGLPRKGTAHTGPTKNIPTPAALAATKMGWLSVVALTLMRPFRAANAKFQTYRRKV